MQITGFFVCSGQAETPETAELRKEVNCSREQTRLQCKQLHDIDVRMRHKEQSVAAKEQEVQRLLEELYIQEIYAEGAIEAAIGASENEAVDAGEHGDERARGARGRERMVELIINERNSFNSSHVDFVQLQQKRLTMDGVLGEWCLLGCFSGTFQGCFVLFERVVFRATWGAD